MIDLSQFREIYFDKRQVGYFSDGELEILQGNFPDEVIEFLRQEGKCTYRDDFLWTVLPDEYYSMMEGWGFENQGIDPKKCHACLRTSFGSLIYCYEKEFYSFSPFIADNGTLGSSFDFLLNYQITGDILDGVFWFDLHQRMRSKMEQLKEDEIYAIVPSIPLGGSPETSKVEVVKMREHLAILAELYDHRVTKY